MKFIPHDYQQFCIDYQNNYFVLEVGDIKNYRSTIYMEDQNYDFVAGAPYVLLVPEENT